MLRRWFYLYEICSKLSSYLQAAYDIASTAVSLPLRYWSPLWGYDHITTANPASFASFDKSTCFFIHLLVSSGTAWIYGKSIAAQLQALKHLRLQKLLMVLDLKPYLKITIIDLQYKWDLSCIVSCYHRMLQVEQHVH